MPLVRLQAEMDMMEPLNLMGLEPPWVFWRKCTQSKIDSGNHTLYSTCLPYNYLQHFMTICTALYNSIFFFVIITTTSISSISSISSSSIIIITTTTTTWKNICLGLTTGWLVQKPSCETKAERMANGPSSPSPVGFHSDRLAMDINLHVPLHLSIVCETVGIA